jgi:hypothetical protein
MAHKASRRPLSRVRLYICSGQSMEVLKIVCVDVPPAQLALFRLSGAHFFAARKDWQIQTLGRRRVLLQCASCKTPQLGVQTIFVLCSTPFARPSAFGMISLCAGGRAGEKEKDSIASANARHGTRERKRLNYCAAAAGAAISFLVALKAPFITIIADSSR